MRKIKLLIMDLDGTLTDGKLYFAPNGEIMKAFNVKDGLMIAELAKYGIIPVILTGRESQITLSQCKGLKITEVHQGVQNKVKQLNQIMEKYHCSFYEVAYIGDDLNDLECMKLCGMSGCPSDAVDQVKIAADYICNAKGGEGAVREFIEYFVDNCFLDAFTKSLTQSTA
jgi:3-deoxy-D-manno-octulosonate 8-phosphate phosphatase (KDO 8-P phosphatase)